MINFYKIDNGEAFTGSGEVVPFGFTEYIVGQEPQVLKDALAIEAQVKIAQYAKQAKQLALDSITVTTTSGKVFDGREKDVTLMSGAIQASSILAITSTQWKLHDNTIATITLDELKEALALSMQSIGILKLS